MELSLDDHAPIFKSPEAMAVFVGSIETALFDYPSVQLTLGDRVVATLVRPPTEEDRPTS